MTAGRNLIQGGSSPLTRGKPRGEGAPCVPEGLIPTHAGKTRPARVCVSWLPAHPHSRGENRSITAMTAFAPGSSPLTRGKHCLAFLCVSAFGLIPAHAGKTGKMVGNMLSPRAHPRSRGENRAENADLQTRAGSSPLTRGKHVDVRSPRARGGLIPAHAGKT